MTQHYFSETPAGELRTREIEVHLAGAPRTVVTAGGVFSPDHLDRGTAVLLRALAGADEGLGPVLDIGCGWGPIALDAALRAPERTVWAVDVNERSRALTLENAARLGLTNLRVAAPDDVPATVEFADIRSNPPIRVGKEALHGILQRWLPRLAADGTAHLVVAKHLGADSLQRWIGSEFPEMRVDRAARDKGFHVIRARR
ncbi:class I SAM-dependent methyltransferase [Leucobacter triazinivorans]|uniref:16S rRNA methyltransferase n=1 Tax=Leucobacter triazinivorans TaxID=1784719 RepID=A0A4P6KCW9_9MICO|nr:methyltransferase [Leucobacter triazinivorans]QBE47870.1 16S rRNA methyltransferase [Leucobacter triazinivorans]